MTTTTERLLELAAAYQQKADALRLAATELNGHRTTRKQQQAPQVIEAAVKLRQAQRSPKSKSPSTVRRVVERDRKAQIVAAILKERGPLPIKALAQAAREAGIEKLTGIHSYVYKGYLKRSGTRKGHYTYAFRAMPPAAAADPTSTPR